ncbi:hypothetical protein DOY81_009007 [Sarcophaga bullata]|nr:hypothetical protein DOY81_009007 [Sarcophaga bullata]
MRTKKVDNILNRLHVAMPAPRDDKDRSPCIPEQALARLEKNAAKAERKRKLEKEIEEEMGDDYTLDLKKNYSEIAEEERYDVIPEFWEGHNIADYIDADIFEKLEELERAEGIREEGGVYDIPDMSMDETLKEIREMAKKIREKRFLLRDEKRLQPRKNKPIIPRHKQPKRLANLKRKTPRNEMGIKNTAMKKKAQIMAKKDIAKKVGRLCLKGEADRFIGTKMPKHLYAGKRGSGTADRR